MAASEAEDARVSVEEGQEEGEDGKRVLGKLMVLPWNPGIRGVLVLLVY